MQDGFDFENALPGQPVPVLPAVRDRKLVEWLKPRPELNGSPSGEICATCKGVILSDDVFGLKFGEHAECFDLPLSKDDEIRFP